MKKAGIIGGLGPVSTAEYYKGIVEGFRAVTKNTGYPRIVIDSVDMSEELELVANEDRRGLVKLLAQSVSNLASAGADFAAIASNTPHFVFEELRAVSTLPLISIVEETCQRMSKMGCRRAVVLGTAFTMSGGLYSEALRRFGIEAFSPDEKDRSIIEEIIFNELEEGIVRPESKRKMLEISNSLISKHNADSLILGCTELPIIISPADMDITVINTTQIHIDSIVRAIME